MAIKARKTASGTYEVFDNDQRVATGSEAVLKDYNLTPDQVEQPQPVQPPAPDAVNLTPLKTPVAADTLAPAQDPTLPEAQAPQVQQEFVTSVAADVKNARTTLENAYETQQADIDKQLEDLRKKEKEILDSQQELSQPFREELENKERERLYINENFQANQKLVNELDTLLTEGNEMLRGERNRFASRSSIAAGVSRTLDDVNARAGVIQAVLSARNGQIAQAYTMIDRSVTAITADRKDQLSYYDTLLSLNNQGQLKLDGDSKKIAEEKTTLLKGDLDRAEKTADTIREAMLDPDLAQAYAETGVTLLDTPEEINKKLATYSYAKEVRDLSNDMATSGYSFLPAGQSAPAGASVVTVTDSKGKEKTYYKLGTKSGSGTGAGGIAGLSSLAKIVYEQPHAYHDLTATQKAEVLDELESLGFRVPRKLSAEQEKLQKNAESGLFAISTLEDLIYSEDGTLDSGALKTASIPIIGGFTKIGNAQREIADVITRLRTGAAINESEERFYKSQTPRSFDGPELVEQKLNQLKALYAGFSGVPVTLQALDGTIYRFEDMFDQSQRLDVRKALENGYVFVDV